MPSIPTFFLGQGMGASSLAWLDFSSPPARAAVLGTAPKNFEQSIEMDAAYWGKEKDVATDRFNQWIVG